MVRIDCCERNFVNLYFYSLERQGWHESTIMSQHLWCRHVIHTANAKYMLLWHFMPLIDMALRASVTRRLYEMHSSVHPMTKSYGDSLNSVKQLYCLCGTTYIVSDGSRIISIPVCCEVQWAHYSVMVSHPGLGPRLGLLCIFSCKLYQCEIVQVSRCYEEPMTMTPLKTLLLL